MGQFILLGHAVQLNCLEVDFVKYSSDLGQHFWATRHQVSTAPLYNPCRLLSLRLYVNQTTWIPCVQGGESHQTHMPSAWATFGYSGSSGKTRNMMQGSIAGMSPRPTCSWSVVLARLWHNKISQTHRRSFCVEWSPLPGSHYACTCVSEGIQVILTAPGSWNEWNRIHFSNATISIWV